MDGAALRKGQPNLAHAPGQREQGHFVVVLSRSVEPAKGRAAVRWRSSMEWIFSGVGCWRRPPCRSRSGATRTCGLRRNGVDGVPSVRLALGGMAFEPGLRRCPVSLPTRTIEYATGPLGPLGSFMRCRATAAWSRSRSQSMPVASTNCWYSGTRGAVSCF